MAQSGTSNKRQVKPGPGPVCVRWWKHEETATEGEMRFRDDRDYVFCLDRIPKKTATNFSGQPSCDLDNELGHILGVIEVEHTYVWQALPDWNISPLNKDTFVSFKNNRYNKSANEYRLDFSIRRDEAGGYEGRTRVGSTELTDEVLNKLLYALRSCQWKELKTPYQFQISPPVTRSSLKVDDGGGPKEAIIQYDKGVWIMNVDGKQFSSIFPHSVFFKVQKLIQSDVAIRTGSHKTKLNLISTGLSANFAHEANVTLQFPHKSSILHSHRICVFPPD